jgi:hypothetical protein
MRARLVRFVAVFQAILLFGHWFVYQTWTRFHSPAHRSGTFALAVAVAILSISFVTASLLAWRSHALPVRLYYAAAATWLGFFNFFFLAAIASWIVWGVALLAHLPASQPLIASTAFGIALLAGLIGFVNAMWIRVRRVAVKLPNLPPSWRGRVAALVTDTHLGHVRGANFARRISGLRAPHGAFYMCAPTAFAPCCKMPKSIATRPASCSPTRPTSRPSPPKRASASR